jgi:hypothetical protein
VRSDRVLVYLILAVELKPTVHQREEGKGENHTQQQVKGCRWKPNPPVVEVD